MIQVNSTIPTSRYIYNFIPGHGNLQFSYLRLQGLVHGNQFSRKRVLEVGEEILYQYDFRLNE